MPRTGRTGSKAERDALRQEMLVRGCSLELIAAEMERRWGFRPREAYRHAHGWSQDEVAARFTEVAGRLGGDVGQLMAGQSAAPPAPMIGTRIGEYERWPHGGRRPSPYALTVLAAVLGTTVVRLLDYDDHRHLPDQERTVLAAVLAAAATPPAVPPAPSIARGPGGVVDSPRPAAADLRSKSPSHPTEAPDPGRARHPVRGLRVVPDDEAAPGPGAAAGHDEPAGAAVGSPAVEPLSLSFPAALAVDPSAGDPASTARRLRRDRLLSGSAESLRSEEEVIMDAAGQSAEFGEWAEASNVGSTTLEQIDEDVRGIARSYLSNPPLPLMLATLRIRNRTFTLLEGRQHPNQTTRLYVAAGRLCGLLGWMASDLGRHAEAETQARTGWLCAELAGADGLRAWIRATQSKVAYWDGRVEESARLADDGLRFGAPDSAGVLLASLAARAWARLGNADAAHAALHRAEEERAAAGPDEVGGLYGFSEAQQNYLAGTTHLWLHEPAEALEAADRAVWLYRVGDPAERFYGAEMLALIDAATAHIQAGELDGAAEKLAPVLSLPADQRLETFTQRLGEMRDALRRSRYALSRPAADIQRQIEDFRADALSRYLSR